VAADDRVTRRHLRIRIDGAGEPGGRQRCFDGLRRAAEDAGEGGNEGGNEDVLHGIPFMARGSSFVE
jgi:hypothetical protein